MTEESHCARTMENESLACITIVDVIAFFLLTRLPSSESVYACWFQTVVPIPIPFGGPFSSFPFYLAFDYRQLFSLGSTEQGRGKARANSRHVRPSLLMLIEGSDFAFKNYHLS